MVTRWSRSILALILFVSFIGCGGDDTSSSSVLDEDFGTTPSDMGSDSESEDECPDECNDGDACTSDSCVDGVCVHEYDEELCCTSDQCEIDGACYENGAANPENTCEICVVVTAPDAWTVDAAATTCDDGDACTMGDRCVAGECVGSAFECDDGNPCTDGVCDGEGGCTFENNTDSCDDGDLCTTGSTCSEGACGAGEPLDCDDGNPCTTAQCDPDVGCVVEFNDGASCTAEEADVCTVSATCSQGECVIDEVDSCDDSDVCTIDYCDPATGCTHTDISDRCEDGNPCTDVSCDPEEGCVFDFNTNACEDGNLCTMNTACSMGTCVGEPVPVDDGNVCTDDSCDPAVGVQNVPNTLPCDNDDACTVNDVCSGGSCQAGAPRDCDDNNVCTADSCDSDTGCVNVDISSTCDDGNPCTVNSCDPVNGCQTTVVQSFTCRPLITVNYPPRAATIQDSAGSVVTVTGTVDSGAGDITDFVLNGQPVSVDPSGAFSVDVTPSVGSNVLVFEATDALGTEVNRVQGYHWSPSYTQPVSGASPSGTVSPGLGIYLDQDSIDDKQAPPPTDLAAIFEGVLAGFDLSGFFDPSEALAEVDPYEVFLTSLSFNDVSVELDAINGGLSVSAGLLDIEGDLFFDCVGGAVVCFFAGGDSTGGLTIDSITIEADLIFSISASNTLEVDVQNAQTTVSNLDIFSDNGWTNFLIGLFTGDLEDEIADIEAELNTQLATVLAPLLEDGLGALAFNQVFDLPRLDGSPQGISVNLESDFLDTDFRGASPGPQGGSFDLRAWSTADTRGVPAGSPYDDNSGVPMREGCGAASQELVIPRAAPLEIVFADDTINQILRAAWWGGLLEFPVDASLLGDVDLSQFGVSNLDLDVSGLLPPIATDCVAGDLTLYVADLEITASLDLFGQPLDAVVYVAFEAPITLGANGSDIEIVIQSIENVELEVNVVQESMLSAKGALESLLRTELVPALGGLLGDGSPLASFPLPEIDLSASLGQPPGTSVIAIQPLTSGTLPPARQSGNTVIYGRLQ